MRIALACTILALAASLSAAEPAAEPYGERIKALEAEIRALVDEQTRSAGAAGAAASPDYAEAKARAVDDVRRRLQIVEYHLADNDYARAVDACNAILRDHPHEPATVRLKYRVLMSMVERERALIERERQYRADEALAEGQTRGIIPKDGPKLARTVWVFDEDIEDAERAAVRRRLQAKVTLNYDGVVVGEVLKPLFATAGINYVILDEALPDKTLTLHLIDDTVENALKTIAKLVDVRYNYSANTVFIGAADSEVMVSEIIRLASGLTDVITEPEMPQAIGGVTGGDGQNAAQQQQQQQQQANGQQQPTSDLERFLEKVPDIVAGWPTEGKLYLERKSNTLYARATPAAIAELKRMIAALDYHSVQVLIEARFVEVTEDAQRQLGIDWGGAALGDKFSVTGPNGSITQPSGVTGAVANAAPASAGGGGLLAKVLFTPTGTFGLFSAIQALESQNKAESLAAPRILTLNNAVGRIELLETVSYIDNYTTNNYNTSSSQTDSSTITNSNVVATPEWKEKRVGYTLRIRPSIARNSDIITLDLRPSVSQPTGAVVEDTFTYQPAAGEDAITKPIRRPEFSERNLATTLHVKNGQTVVLGGLTTDVVRSGDSGVPGLRRVPVLGRLFSNQNNAVDRSNLLIFVTAHIIDPSGAKIGEEVRRLRDTAAVVLPEEIRLAEAEKQASEAQRAADADAAAREAAKPPSARPRSGKLTPRN